MAKRKVGAVDLTAAIKDILTKYGDDVYKVLDASIKDVAEASTEKLKGVHQWANNVSGSAYSAAWAVQDVQKDRVRVNRVIYNNGHARLTHLLEKGHVSRNGTGRTFGKVKAYPHIKPVEEWAVKELSQVVEERLNKL